MNFDSHRVKQSFFTAQILTLPPIDLGLILPQRRCGMCIISRTASPIFMLIMHQPAILDGQM